MSDPYRFDYDPAARLLKLKLSGMWNADVAARFTREAAALRGAVERAGHREATGRILIDLSDFPVQVREIAEQVGAALPNFGDKAGRVAVVNSVSTLQQLQTQRVLPSEKVRTFDTAAAALAWLEQPA